MKMWIHLFFFFILGTGFYQEGHAVEIRIDPKGSCHIEGKEYPVIGFGTYRLKKDTCFEAVTHAAAAGYRVIDTATFYDNFEPIGHALKTFGRENFYLISKVWPDAQTPDKLRSDVAATLQRLQTSYLDAYLLHWPNSSVPIEETLFAMEQLRKAGKIRHLGLCNINVNHLKRALEVGVPISWVQVEMHPFFYDAELIAFCQEHSIAVQAWAPLGRGRLSNDPLLKEIGMRYGKTASQVALRWIVQNGCMPLPGSHNEAHIRQNLESLNFTLSAADMDLINARAKSGVRERVTAAAKLDFTDEFDFSYAACWPKKLKLEVLQGHEIGPHVQKIVQFVHKIYRNAPYFYNGDDAEYKAYLESFPGLSNVAVCLALEDDEIMGIAVGLPMPDRQVYQETLLENGYDLQKLFYLGEFGLEPKYQGKGIEMALFQNIQKFAQATGKFNQICFWEIGGTLGDHASSYFPNDEFWKTLGFIRHPELNFEISWTNIGDSQESAHKAVYWMDNL